ncbi:Transposase [Bacteroidales bacterium Barb6XT]|nr:Transposase [Bacteroidales bacterium Barb6XT]
MNKTYQTSLSDSHRSTIAVILKDKRKRKHSLREIFDAIFYMLKTGCQRRMLPKDFPNRQLVYYCFNKRKRDGSIEEIHERLRDLTRKNAGKKPFSGLGLTDSQSVETTRNGGLCRGQTAVKRQKEENGMSLSIQWDCFCPSLFMQRMCMTVKELPFVLSELRFRFSRLVRIIAGGGYRGEPAENTGKAFGRVLEIVLRKEDSTKFQVIPKRWAAERTFAQFESYRRLSKDFEYHTETNQTMIHPAMIKLMLNRIKL